MDSRQHKLLFHQAVLACAGCVLTLLPTPFPAMAEESPEPAAEPAERFSDEVTVTGTREERPLHEVPISIGVVGEDELKTGREEGLDETFNGIPGVFAGSNDGSSDVKISVRGFGARSTFGVRDILVMVDGVSITDADGFTRLDQIDLAAADRVEVLKGPASAIYGNAAFGGVVNVITRHGQIGEPQRRVRLEAGELGFSKALASLAGGSAALKTAYALHLSDFRLDDFRDHNETDTRRLNGTLDWFATDRTTVRGLLNMSQHRNEIPGPLDRRRFDEDPSQVLPLYVLQDYRRDDNRYRLGAVLEHRVGRDSQLEGRLFALSRDLDHPIFQVIDQEGRRFMGGVRFSRHLSAGSTDHRLTFGLDGDREAIDSKRFVNVGGEPGAPTLSADQTVESYAGYVQDEMLLAENLSLTLGARFDSITYDNEDRLLADGDQSDRRTFERTSPKLGLLWSPKPGFSAFLNLSTAFQTPTKSELTATVDENGFNPELDPQLARHAELGVRGTAKQRLRYELSLFQTDVEDEILPKERVNFRTIFGNVGETRHRGAELALDLLLPADLVLGVGYGWSDNTFRDFADFSGNVIPGHPEHQGTVSLATRRPAGLNGTLRFQRTGSILLNDSNQDVQRPYSVLDLALRYDWQRFSLFVHGNNLTDEHYAAWLGVNDSRGQFFLPAKPRNFSVGVDIRF